MKKVEISYNPYKMITTVLIDGVDVCKDGHYDKFREFIKNEIPLQTWIEPIPYMDWAGFVNEISDPEVNDEVMVTFSGRVIDFEDLKRSIADQNDERSSPVIYHFKHKKVLDDKVLSTNIEDVVKELKSDRFHDLVAQRTTEGLTRKYNDLDENYTIAKESVFYIVLAGVYSSGKSTLLNALIRHDVLPTSTRTCTSKNCRIRHDRSLGSKLSLVCYDEDENVVVEKRTLKDPRCGALWVSAGQTDSGLYLVIFSNGDITPQSTFKTGINALKSDDIISSCGQRISCFYLCSQVYCAQTGTSALWDVTYEPDVEAMDRFLLISQQVVTFSSTRNVRNLNMRGAYTMYIVGIDIAKRKHEAAVIDGEGAVIIKPFSFTNNCSGYNRLLAMLAKAKLPLDEVSFAMEATGHYWLALFTRLQKEGFRVQVINPVQTNSIRNFYIRQAKTDPRDALLIAEVIRFGHFSESTLHPENIYELRELCRGRHAIVSMQADVKRKVVALLDQVFPEYETAFTNMFSDTSMAILQTCPTPKELSEMPLEELCHLIEVSSHKRFRMAKARELQELARNSFGFAMAGDVFSTMIRLYAKHLDFLKQQVREMDRKIAEIMETLDTPITTITGIGPTLGAYILSEIGDISRFSSAAKLAAYAGIDPTMRQSGEYNGVRNRMSKRGSPYLRHAIWLAASSAVLHDPALKFYFQKKRDEGKPYMASVGHACRKMVSIIYAVMRDNKAYTPCIPNEISA